MQALREMGQQLGTLSSGLVDMQDNMANMQGRFGALEQGQIALQGTVEAGEEARASLEFRLDLATENIGDGKRFKVDPAADRTMGGTN